MNKGKSVQKEKRNNIKCFYGQKLRLIIGVMSFGLFAFSSEVYAQKENSMADNFNVNLEISNMHIWHGSVVTPGAMIASSLEFQSSNNKIVAGLWGGAGFSGNYREFSYYAKWNFSDNLNISLISHNNYSDIGNPDIFSYDKYTSPNFVDVVLEYTLPDRFPLTAYWSTILFGNGGDFYTGEDGVVTDSYSTYAELRYPIINQESTRLRVFAGGAFSFFTKKTFYSDSPNLVNVGLTLEQDVNLFSAVVPVSATAFWNPESRIGALRVGILLF